MNSLTLRIIAPILLAGLVYAVVAAFSSHRAATHESAELIELQLESAAATLLSGARFHGDDSVSFVLLRGLDGIPEPFYTVWTDRGATRASKVPEAVAQAADWRPESMTSGLTVRTIGGGDWMFFRADSDDGATHVVVGQSASVRDELALRLAWKDMRPFLLGLPLLAAITIFLISHGLRPLRRFAGEVAARGPERLEPVPADDLPTEMRPLADAMNRLLARLAATLEAERHFTADAAHELRTPLAALGAQLDAAKLELAAGASPEPAMEKAGMAASRLRHLIDQLLFLARLDSGQDFAFTDIDLNDLAAEECAAQAPAALARGIQVELDADVDVRVRGNRELLRALLRNLLDNAIRYAPDGAKAGVRLLEDDGVAVIAVSDSGKGIPESMIPMLGRRFHRLGSQERPGVGLGLSIVSRIAALHDCGLAFSRCTELRGLRAELRFPDARPTRSPALPSSGGG